MPICACAGGTAGGLQQPGALGGGALGGDHAHDAAPARAHGHGAPPPRMPCMLLIMMHNEQTSTAACCRRCLQ